MGVTLEVVKLVPCAVCREPAIYFGDRFFQNSKRLCSYVCDAIDEAITPGEWIDAAEMMEGGSLHHRLPEIWSE